MVVRKGKCMKGNSSRSGMAARVIFWVMTFLVLCGLSCIGTSIPAVATPGEPSLTLHLLKTQHGQGGQGSLLPAATNSPAGAGYVYRAVKLDRNKVKQFTDGMRPSPSHVQERLTAEVTAKQAVYRDSSGLEFYGASDADGIISTSTVTQSQGVWLKGARLDFNSASLSGGVPAEFDGTAASPSYWFVSLVAAPKGVTVRTDACVIQLPNLAAAGGSPLFQVDVYPKLDINDGHVLPGNKVKPNGGLARTGASLLVPGGLISLFLILGTVLVLAERRRIRSN